METAAILIFVHTVSVSSPGGPSCEFVSGAESHHYMVGRGHSLASRGDQPHTVIYQFHGRLKTKLNRVTVT
jgi:hypothetical protein